MVDMMNIGNVKIYAKADNRSGLSALSGKKVESIRQVPEHLVEVHLFTGADAAAAFVDGLMAAGLGNNTAFDWEPETTESNRCVLLARFDEPRPEANSVSEAVKVVHHRRTGHDSAAYSRSMDAIFASRDIERKRQNVAVTPVRDALRPLEPSGESWGSGWYRCSFGNGQHVAVSWSEDGGPYEIAALCAEAGEGPIDLSETFIAMAAARSVTYDPDEREFRKTGVSAEGLVAAAADISAAEEECLAARKKAYHEDFMSRMKMTASRRRFLEAGRETGIRVHVNRGNKKARAGGIEVGATEIGTLLNAGWIEPAQGGYSVADAGVEALETMVPARPRSTPRP